MSSSTGCLEPATKQLQATASNLGKLYQQISFPDLFLPVFIILAAEFCHPTQLTGCPSYKRCQAEKSPRQTACWDQLPYKNRKLLPACSQYAMDLMGSSIRRDALQEEHTHGTLARKNASWVTHVLLVSSFSERFNYTLSYPAAINHFFPLFLTYSRVLLGKQQIFLSEAVPACAEQNCCYCTFTARDKHE